MCRDGEGGSKLLYHMLSKTRVMCANNPKCSEHGKCNWIGDYGSYQEHIRTCKNVPELSFATLEENCMENLIVSGSDESTCGICDTIDASPSPESCDAETVDVSAPPDEIEAPIVQTEGDVCLMGLVGEWLDVKRTERIDSDDLCSTNDSETRSSMEPEPSDISSETNESCGPSDVEASQPMPSPDALQEAKPVGWQGQSQVSSEAISAHQTVGQWQMQQYKYQQYQAAQYQAAAAQWQMAQWQMANWQHAQAQAMQWQMAQRYQQNQQQSRKVAGNNMRK